MRFRINCKMHGRVLPADEDFNLAFRHAYAGSIEVDESAFWCSVAADEHQFEIVVENGTSEILADGKIQ